jgi:hypothetical protein
MRASGSTLTPQDRLTMAGFALREDTEELARDAINWFASRLVAPEPE